MFFQRGLRVELLHTNQKLAPFGGTVLFCMDGMVRPPVEKRFPSLGERHALS
jgi:hypothetical protein